MNRHDAAAFPFAGQAPDRRYASYDPTGDRTLAQWRTFLRPGSVPVASAKAVAAGRTTSISPAWTVFDGATVMNGDGKVRWSIYREHPDIVTIKRILPANQSRQVYCAVESSVHSAEGKLLMEGFPPGWKPVNWTGGPVRDLVSADGRRLGRFDGKEVQVMPGVSPNEGDRAVV